MGVNNETIFDLVDEDDKIVEKTLKEQLTNSKNYDIMYLSIRNDLAQKITGYATAVYDEK